MMILSHYHFEQIVSIRIAQSREKVFLEFMYWLQEAQFIQQ